MSQATVRKEGQVKIWHEDRGFGFILGERGDCFVHYTSIRNGAKFKELQEGQKVSYTPEKTERGWQAKDVEILDDMTPPGTTETGIVVKWYETYGFIRGETGNQYFVHFKYINSTDTIRKLKVGAVVTFSPLETDKGWQAADVTVIQEPAEEYGLVQSEELAGNA